MPLVKRSDDPTKGDEHDDKKIDDVVAAQQERMELIVAAIDELDTKTDYTGGGLPDIEALSSVSGVTGITASERDQAWDTYNG